jgi:Zn-dependent protease
MSDAPATSSPPPATQTTFAVYSGPSLDAIKSKVASQFQVNDAFLDPNGIPTFAVTSESTKHSFLQLVAQLKPEGLIAAIRRTGDAMTIKVFQKPHVRPSSLRINLAFFVATVVTVTVAGFYVWDGEIPGLVGPSTISAQYNAIVFPGANKLLESLVFAAGLLAIIGLHEFGHKATTVYHKLDATFPYFVPGPPPIGTFGALISLKGPPTNRDQLFDLGLSGPVVGFMVTIVVGLAGMLLGPSQTPANAPLLSAWAANCGAPCTSGLSFPSSPLLLILLSHVATSINPNALGYGQLIFAAQIGALLTFLNIVPAWQLDGGHISRAVFGAYGHRIATLIGLGLLIYSGFFVFAILVLVMMMLGGRGLSGVEPLDDVSPVSTSRKILYLVGLAMLVLTFAYLPLQI